MTSNIQGLVALDKRINFSKLVAKFCPTLFCVQETNSNPLIRSNIFIKNYSVFINPAYRKGTGTLICALGSIYVVEHKILIPGHVQVLNFKCDGQIYILFNVYLPFDDNFAIRIVNVIKDEMASQPNFEFFFAGDYNYVDRLSLDRVSSTFDRPRLRLTMQDVLTEFSLQDSFRILFPYLIKMTHFGTQSHRPGSRLERIYITPNLATKVARTEFFPSISDHLIYSTSIILSSRKNTPVC